MPLASNERTRRLDTDAAAVQILTIHGSKGLQYPVVYLPALLRLLRAEPAELLFHDDDGTRRSTWPARPTPCAERAQRAPARSSA